MAGGMLGDRGLNGLGSRWRTEHFGGTLLLYTPGAALAKLCEPERLPNVAPASAELEVSFQWLRHLHFPVGSFVARWQASSQLRP
jgi:hypothetical protein